MHLADRHWCDSGHRDRHIAEVSGCSFRSTTDQSASLGPTAASHSMIACCVVAVGTGRLRSAVAPASCRRGLASAKQQHLATHACSHTVRPTTRRWYGDLSCRVMVWSRFASHSAAAGDLRRLPVPERVCALSHPCKTRAYHDILLRWVECLGDLCALDLDNFSVPD